ncbi:MAG: RluA family pseudouridine synthase [Frisingicoccus sp.]
MIDVKILYEDAQVLVCVNRRGWRPRRNVPHPWIWSAGSKNYLVGKQSGSSGKGVPYIGVVHRLDRPVGGVMVYAKNPKAAADLSRQFSEHQTEKTYLALLTGQLPETSGTLTDYLERDGRTNTSKVVTKGGKKAGLSYRKLEEKQGLTLVEIRLQTGRHHQIRVQTAHAGAGIYGDMKYNSEGTKKWNEKEGIGSEKGELCLFSCRLSFKHPVSRETMCFEALPERGRMTIDEWPSLSYYKKRK